MKPTLKLIPRNTSDRPTGTQYYEAVEIQDINGYPIAIVHIDTFFCAADNTMAIRLSKSETLTVSLSIVEEVQP